MPIRLANSDEPLDEDWTLAVPPGPRESQPTFVRINASSEDFDARLRLRFEEELLQDPKTIIGR